MIERIAIGTRQRVGGHGRLVGQWETRELARFCVHGEREPPRLRLLLGVDFDEEAAVGTLNGKKQFVGVLLAESESEWAREHQPRGGDAALKLSGRVDLSVRAGEGNRFAGSEVSHLALLDDKQPFGWSLEALDFLSCSAVRVC